MQKITRIVLLFSITLLIAACGDLDGFITITHQSDSATEEEVVDVVENDVNVESDEIEDEVGDKEETTVASPTDLEGVLKQMKKASQSITSTVMTGTSTHHLSSAGVSSVENSVLDSNIYLDPFIHHTSMTTTSPDGNYTSEMYMTEDAMYVFSSDVGSWMVIENAFVEGRAKSVFQESFFDHLLDVKEYFTLSENGKHFIITYSGPDESYQEIVGGSILQMDAFKPADEMLSDIMGDIIMTGTLEFIISKDTFMIIEHKSMTSTTLPTIDMVVTDKNHYKYSGFNTVDSFDVPDEIKSNAMKVPF